VQPVHLNDATEGGRVKKKEEKRGGEREDTEISRSELDVGQGAVQPVHLNETTEGGRVKEKEWGIDGD
jgi:hypothetical protein